MDKEVVDNLDDQIAGVNKLLQHKKVFVIFGDDLRDAIFVISDRFATGEDRGYTTLYIPYDFDIDELGDYLEYGKVPNWQIRKEELEAKMLKEKERKEGEDEAEDIEREGFEEAQKEYLTQVLHYDEETDLNLPKKSK